MADPSVDVLLADLLCDEDDDLDTNLATDATVVAAPIAVFIDDTLSHANSDSQYTHDEARDLTLPPEALHAVTLDKAKPIAVKVSDEPAQDAVLLPTSEVKAVAAQNDEAIIESDQAWPHIDAEAGSQHVPPNSLQAEASGSEESEDDRDALLDLAEVLASTSGAPAALEAPAPLQLAVPCGPKVEAPASPLVQLTSPVMDTLKFAVVNGRSTTADSSFGINEGVSRPTDKTLGIPAVANSDALFKNTATACSSPAVDDLSEPAHERALKHAQAVEESLLSGCSRHGTPTTEPLAELSHLLQSASQDWNPAGRPDAGGAMIGGSVALKLEELGAVVPGLPRQWAALGMPKVVALTGPVLAVGTSLGAAFISQLPLFATTASVAATPSASPAGGQPSGTADVPLMQLGEARSETEAVSALAFSHVGAPGDMMWLLVGHSSGAVAVWDVQKRPARLVTSIAQHGLPIVHVSFFPGRGTTAALSADRRGRLMLHSFASLLLRTSTSSRQLLDGGYGTIAAVQHLSPFAMPPAPSSGDEAAGPRSEGSTRVGDGVVAVLTASAVNICRIKTSGEMIALSSMSRPEGSIPASLPYAAWLPVSRRSGTGTGGGGGAAVPLVHDDISMPHATLAVAWADRLYLLGVALVGDQGSADSGAAEAAAAAAANNRRGVLYRGLAAARPSAADALTPALAASLSARFPLHIMRTWSSHELGGDDHGGIAGGGAGGDSLPAGIIGLHWYDGEALGLVLQQGLQMRLLVLGTSMEVREQVDCLDSPVSSPHVPSSCHVTQAGHGSRLLLLGASDSLYCSRLMPWQERLRTLQDIGKWRLGLRYALEFYQAALRRAAATSITANGPAAGGEVQQQLEQLQQWLLALMMGDVVQVLQQLSTEAAKRAGGSGGGMAAAVAAVLQDPQHTELMRQVQDAAQVAICCCIIVSAQQVLFDRVFPLFRDAGAAPVLLECLEPLILGDALPRLAPEVMQALVEHYALGLGRPDRVERCVLHMDILSLDLDQVIRLCEAHQLYSALIYMYNRINDYRKPVLDLLAAIAFAATPEQRSAFGYKLLVYLRNTFQGQAFPPGSGNLPVSSAAALDDLKAQLLGLLLFLDRADLAREWRRDMATVSACCVDPHPALQVLLSVDVHAAMAVLGEAVNGWDAVETDLRAAAGKPAAELDSVLVATQVLVNALIGLMESGQFKALQQQQQRQRRQQHGAVSAAGGQLLRGWHLGADLGAAMDFIAGLLAAGRVNVPPAFALQLVRHIAQVAQLPSATLVPGMPQSAGRSEGCGTAAADGGEAFTVGHGRNAASTVRAEDLFSAVVRAVGINAPGELPDRDKLSMQDSEVVLQLAQHSGLWSAVALIHHLRGDFAAALAYRLSHGEPTAPFDYLERCLPPSATGEAVLKAPGARAAVRAAMLGHVQELVQRDASATAALVLRHLPNDQQEVLQQCRQRPEAQYRFLRALLEQSERAAEEAASRAGAEHGTSGSGATASLSSGRESAAATAAAAAATAPPCELLQSSEVCNIYVALLCRYDPPAVLPFLESHQHYDVKVCIARCREHRVMDAQAYLHERLGDLDAALHLYVQSIQSANVVLVRDLCSGAIPTRVGSPAMTDQSTSSSDSTACEGAAGQHWLASKIPNAAALHSLYSLLTSATARSAGGTGQHTSTTPGRASSQAPPGAPPDTGQPPASGGAVDRGVEPEGFNEHIRWLTALSPRLHLVLPRVCGRPGAGVPGAKCLASRTSGLLKAASMAVDGPPLPEPITPPQLTAAWQALAAATAFCRRNAHQVRHSGADQVATHGHWFQLLRLYVERLRNAHADSVAARPLEPPVRSAAPPHPPTQPATVQRVLTHIFTAFMEEVISCMADHMPLDLIIRHIINSYGRDCFSEFRTTLLGLLGACAYERNILGTANRLITRDVYSTVRSSYRTHAGHNPNTTAEPGLDTAQDGLAAEPVPTNGSASSSPWVSVADLVHSRLLDQQQQRRQCHGGGSATSVGVGSQDDSAAACLAQAVALLGGDTLSLMLTPVRGGARLLPQGLFTAARDLPGRRRAMCIDVRPFLRPPGADVSPRGDGVTLGYIPLAARSDSFDVNDLLAWSKQTANLLR